MKITRLLAIALSLTALTSCTNRELRMELRKLDKIIDNRAEYLDNFEARTSLLRDSMQNATSDSVAWHFSHMLFEEFLRFSTDSAAVYQGRMEKLANSCSSPRMSYFSAISKLQLDIAWSNLHEASLTFESLDTAGLNLSATEQFDYYNNAGAYYVLLRDSQNGEQYEATRNLVNDFRRKAVELDSISVTGRKILAILYNQKGKYQQSLETLLPCWYWDTLTEMDRSLTAYNIAAIYRQMGDETQQMIWLARSAQHDYMVPVNNYLSVYYLAILLYQHRMFERSQKYINLNLSDIIEANYQQRIRRSGEMQVLISAANRKIQMRRTLIISISCLVFLIMTIILISLLKKNRVLFGLTEEKNAQLSTLNRKLEEANTIKDDYLFRYMGLATHYLVQVEDTRHELRQIAKKEGVEAMMLKLRSHGNTDKELANFFKIFDETFLSIFPNFVEQVNSMLRDECRFKLKDGNQLTTELRILATIRLGMKESGKIAEFLNCAPATVYTYRTKILNMAQCPRDQFEQKLMEITSY